MEFRARMTFVLTVAISLVAASRTSAAESAASAPASPAGGPLVLDGKGYVRQHTEFGLMRISGDALRDEGDKLFDKRLPAVERSVKKFLQGRQYDWTKTNWRDVATWIFSGTQAGEDIAGVAMMPSIAPPLDWMKPEFDDAGFDRVRLGTLSMVSDGEVCRQHSSQHRRALYLRTYFEVPDPTKAGVLSLKVVYRGGARAMINGQEIARANLPEGKLDSGTFAADYAREAYIATKDELPPRYRFDLIGDLRGPFDVAPLPEGPKAGEYRRTFGDTVVSRAGWDRLMKLRDRVLGPVPVPANLLRRGPNVLAIEIRASRVHPIVLPGARAGELSEDACRRAWGGGYGCSPRWDHLRLVDLELRNTPTAIATSLGRSQGLRVWVDDLHNRLTVRDYASAGWPLGTVRFVGA